MDKEPVHALQRLEHFFSWFLGSKEFWAAIVGAVVGGVMTGVSALYAQKQAAKDQRQRDQETERRAVKGTMQAIAAELKVLKADNLDPLEEMLKERPRVRKELEINDPVQLAMPHSEQNRFIVFESNAAALGRIDDEKLREHIIRVYGLARGVLDCLNTNARNFEYWRSLDDLNPEKSTIGKMLEGLEITLRNGLSDLQREIGELLPRVEKYLDP